MKTPAIMVLGTGSHVGKSLLTVALCRLFRQSGHRVAPFKSQNMSLNSAATVEGLEIGRAQALQAEAAGLLPSVHMNPILIKPSGDASSQIVVRGKIWKNVSAADYHLHRVAQLMPIVEESYRILASDHELIILEGAGSPAEINLKEHDIANMRMAELADAKCILVGDIDRGGVFASLLGTLELLDPGERARIRGFVINKFRGDLGLLLPGIQQMERRIDMPCLGVVPYLHDLALEEEDSVGLDARRVPAWTRDTSPARPLRIAAIAAPSLANFTDFDPLIREASVSFKFCRTPDDLLFADLAIFPGSKETVQDLQWLRAKGFGDALLQHAKDGGLTVGICGGLQMLGREICDPDGIETAGSTTGLGLLAIRTRMRPEKITVNASGRMLARRLFGQPVNSGSIRSHEVRGYEIHVGETSYLDKSQPFAILDRATEAGCSIEDGCVSEDQRTFGTYLHGLFEDDRFRHAFLEAARAHHQLSPAENLSFQSECKQQDIDRLAAAVGQALDMKTIFDWVGLAYNAASGKKVSRNYMHARTLFAAYSLDWCIGDPEWLPHPVRLIGKSIEIGEQFLRSDDSTERQELFTGSILVAAVVLGASCLAKWPIDRLRRRSGPAGNLVEIALASSCLATKNLLDEAGRVLRALEAGDVPFARKRLARIVGRDTENLNTSEICRASIETLAESLSDGIVAPLFFLSMSGVRGGMAYKAINTLDSMIGHKDGPYFYFGRAAARLDDLANYIPSRISAMLICGSSAILRGASPRTAVSTWFADGDKHASPNAGQPESAMAGALQVRLGGTNTYGGQTVKAPYLGAQFDAPSIAHARSALRLTAIASVVGAAAAMIFLLARSHD